ncbi:glycosyltransferase family 2 protein [Flavobacterium sp. SH_e]|uniref:Glycosyltransferase EpsJ n=1 Tax=Flavobacterium anhuiense TaxID=459526 RepID=A0AAC9D4H8_9FLAO|nr:MULTISPECIES: glycosyltransferase family A protein [Flavobacterium]AOC95312.1 putative glycosyltransferase EpsJ [Flavobacterium anhuiense]MCV2484007.1 glycosyltransferase family 2 protein [Flavobacterium sp. SH_e]SCY85241.1 Glycosyltransferase involved in cell wall bisynthesis [Flavobacterium anhuiense]
MYKISIIVPCYNQAQYLSEALTSVLNQTYENWECIIVNDGSNDNINEIAQKWLDKDFRFKYVSKNNGGLSSARNAGITVAKGEFILPLDADDKIGHNYLKLALYEFQKDSSLKVVYCKAEKFGDEVGDWILKPFSLYNLSKKNMIFCTALYKKKEWELAGGYDTNMIYGLEDWEFWISMLKNDGNVKRIDYHGFYYRIKSSSMIKSLDPDKEKYLYKYLNIKHADFFVNQLGSSIELNNDLEHTRNDYRRKLKSKKFVIDVFLNTFLGFTIFNNKNDLY